ncbi:MAG TPA: zinc ribbon domain-containing protein [Blastocatellia bacterium]|nr:zinc ribbon domain-containing protein [Blastocatellia bacterium]
MPIYVYRCESCDDELEILQARHDAAPGACRKCGTTLERIPSSPSVNLNKFTSRSVERHSKLSVEQQARKEGERLIEHSKKTGIALNDLFEIHDVGD